jgi:hypothetical protein
MQHLKMWHRAAWGAILLLAIGIAPGQTAPTMPDRGFHSSAETSPRPDVQRESLSDWQVVGQVGGPTQAVAVQGDPLTGSGQVYAYVGVGLRLAVLDVTDPAAPTEAGATAPFPYSVEDIVVSGTLAYVASGGAGLRVVNVSDPANPTEVGAWDSPGYAEGIAISGQIVYLADGPYGLWVVDASDPAHPAAIGSAYDMNYAFGVAVAGRYAYIAGAGAGLLVTDVSNPAQPVEMGSLDTPGYAYGVAVSGNTVYVADGWGGLHVVDVSAPVLPDLLGTCAMPGWALDIAVEGDTAYVAAGASGLRLVDVRDPANPQEIGALEEGGLARRVAVRMQRVYLADSTDGLLQIDVTIPQQPSEISRYNPFVEARYVAVEGAYAYVAAGFSGLRVVDVSDPACPCQVAAYDTEGTYATGVVVSGTVAYVPTYLSGIDPHDLHIVDISDPLHPAGLATVDTDGVFRGVAVQGQYLYAADEWGLRVIDVVDPAAPAEVGFIELAFAPYECTIDVTVVGHLAYVANSWGGLAIVDISTPSDLVLVSVYLPDTWTDVTSVVVSEQTAKLGSGFDGLRLIDVSDPTSPTELGSYDTPGFSVAVAISDDLALVSDGGGGVQLLDVSNPANPAPAGGYDTTGFAWHSVVMSDHVYVADSRGGLVVMERVDSHTLAAQSLSLSPQLATDQPISAPPAAVTPDRAPITPFSDCVVTSTADSGIGTMRWCMDNALEGGGITFDPVVFDPLDPVTITLLSPLPPLTWGYMNIDASDAGVILDGTATPAGSSGLLIESDGNVIKGLQVIGFPAVGISISGEATHNQIGGSRLQGGGPLGEGNRLSRNGDAGLSIGGTGAMSNTVLGNLIGTDLSGISSAGNGNGTSIGGGASYNTIGSITDGEQNVIGGSLDNEVTLWGEGTEHNVVRYNLIGTDISGQASLRLTPLPGTWTTGVHLHSGACHNQIGPGNTINGNTWGIQLNSTGTTDNIIVGNWIGTNLGGTAGIGNLHQGVSLNLGVQHNRVGPDNHIAYNGGGGVAVNGATALGNTITANAIHDNAGPGIALTDGGNGALPAPMLTSASPTVIIGTAPAGATVEVFSGRDDEGHTYEGSTTADASGTFTLTQPAGMTGPLLTATATDATGNTSGFSTPIILWTTTHTVTSPLDSGPGTLRQALLDADAGDTITFDPTLFDPQNPLTITLLSALPVLDQGQATIDASAAGVILDGHLLTDSICGLWIGSDGNTVRGLQFVGFNNTALCVDGRYNTIGGDRGQGSAPTGQGNQFGANKEAVSLWGDENTVLGNLIGIDVSGHLAMPNEVGIAVLGAGNRIGGPTPGQRNIISANTFRGIQILGERARFNVVAGNYIGTDISGRYSLGNVSVGVIMEVQASNNVIGGTTPAERNLISGNVETGISISDAGSAHNTVIGNWIGTDASGTGALGNNAGVHLNHCGFNRVGGTQAGEANVISGNRGSAIALAGYEYTDNLILGNLIGVAADGAQPLGNGTGMALHVNTRRTFIGGATIGERNLIADNGVGVHIGVAGTDDNWILGNAIGTDTTGTMRWGNHRAGILVEGYAARTMVQGNVIAYNGDQGSGQTAGVCIVHAAHHTLRRNAIYNNAGPGISLIDDGNEMLPAPVVLTVTQAAVAGAACPACIVEVFSDEADEGRVYEGYAGADANGDWSWTGDLVGPSVTATATDQTGNTSTFSAPWVVWPHRAYLPLVLRQ